MTLIWEWEDYPGFDTLPDAFDYCREAGHPVRVRVGDHLYKLYPSGKAKLLIYTSEVRQKKGGCDHGNRSNGSDG